MSAESKGLTPVSHRDYLLVEVPETAFNFRIDNSGYLLMQVPGSEYASDEYYLDQWTPGNYSIVGLAKDLTERQCWEIYGGVNVFETYKEAVKKLLASHSLKEDNCLILKKVL